MNCTFSFKTSVLANAVARTEVILREALSLVRNIESSLSEYLPESPVFQLNNATAGTRIFFDRHAMSVFELASKIEKQTNAAFHCGAKGPLESTPPFGHDGNHVWRNGPNEHLGFGAIGKGYALDRARELIEREGLTNYCLSAGGSSIVMSGFESSANCWTWRWQWGGEDPSSIDFSHSSGAPICIGVSGTEEQGPHIRNPKHGVAAQVTSAITLMPCAAEADALSTALFVAASRTEEPSTAPATIGLGPEIPAAFVTGEGHLVGTSAFERLCQTMALALVMILLWVPTISAVAEEGGITAETAQEETIDLEDLGASETNPYQVERNGWWILLPVLSLGVVATHLLRPRKKTVATTHNLASLENEQ